MLDNLAIGAGKLFAGVTITDENPGFDAITPKAEGLPGSGVAITITSGIMFFSLLFCLIGLVLSAGLWAVGAFSNNYTQSVNGKKGFLISASSALAIGAAYFVISWMFGAGGKVSTGGGAGE